MTEDTKERKPTMRVILTIYDKEVHVEGENLHTLRNSIIHNIERGLKRAAKIAKRNYLRDQRVAPVLEDGETKKDTATMSTEKETKVTKDTKVSATPVNDMLANLGLKVK